MDTTEEKSINSRFIENMIEHAFISEIVQEAWINNKGKLEILRAEVDDAGYDIVLSWKNKNRYIQLKTSEKDGTTAKQKLNIALAHKENGCIVWIIRETNDKTKRFKFKYLFFGSEFGQPFPDVEKYKTAKHPRRNAKGERKERPNVKEIPKDAFTKCNSCSKLFTALFNEKIQKTLTGQRGTVKRMLVERQYAKT